MADDRFRPRLESFFLRLWYPEQNVATPKTEKSDFLSKIISVLLSGLGVLYSVIIARRLKKRQLYLSGQDNRLTNALVVVIGNVSVGGTGKTPVILAFASALISQGYKVGVVSRGYGGSFTRQSKSGTKLVRSDDSAAEVGDEPALIKRKLSLLLRENALPEDRFGIAIGRDRTRAIQALNSLEPDIILSDDGLQHYKMLRDLEYLVIDGPRGFGNGKLLPSGPLREPVERLKLCHYILIHGESSAELQRILSEESTENPSHFSTFLGSNNQARPLNAAAKRQILRLGNNEPVSEIEGTNAITEGSIGLEILAQLSSIHLVAGLGNPARFFDAVGEKLNSRNPSLICNTHAFSDHHSFTYRDLYGVIGPNESVWDEIAILVTEKDAVKLENLDLSNYGMNSIDDGGQSGSTSLEQFPVAVFAVDYQVALPEAALEPILSRLTKDGAAR